MILDHSGKLREPFLPRKEAFDPYVALFGRFFSPDGPLEVSEKLSGSW
jgi:hypothetical protein